MSSKKEDHKNLIKRENKIFKYLLFKKNFKNSLLVFDKEKYEKAV
jgi:hypothetical protein